MDDQKRQLRKLKRDLKRAGSKRRRRYLKRELVEKPEDAAHTEFRFGRDQTAGLNGLDQDATRQRSPAGAIATGSPGARKGPAGK